MKYFVIQSVSSVLLLRRITISNSPKLTFTFLIFLPLLSLLVKIAASPFQEWFVRIAKNSRSYPAFILITWQKLAPVFLLLYQTKGIIWPFLLLSIIIGRVLQIDKISILEILAYSSVFNLSWMIIAITIRNHLMMIFCLIYWSSVLLVIYWMKTSKQKKNQHNPSIKKRKDGPPFNYSKLGWSTTHSWIFNQINISQRIFYKPHTATSNLRLSYKKS